MQPRPIAETESPPRPNGRCSSLSAMPSSRRAWYLWCLVRQPQAEMTVPPQDPLAIGRHALQEVAQTDIDRHLLIDKFVQLRRRRWLQHTMNRRLMRPKIADLGAQLE